MFDKKIHMLTIGDKIRKLREIRDIKQENMARLLNMTTNGYGKIERDESKITLQRLEEISKILKISIEEIINFKSESIIIKTQNYVTNSSTEIIKDFQNNNLLSDNERKLYEDKIQLLQEIIRITNSK